MYYTHTKVKINIVIYHRRQKIIITSNIDYYQEVDILVENIKLKYLVSIINIEKLRIKH